MPAVHKHVLTKTRMGHWIPVSGVTGGYKSPDMGSGNQTWILCFPLQKQSMLLTTDPSLQSFKVLF